MSSYFDPLILRYSNDMLINFRVLPRLVQTGAMLMEYPVDNEYGAMSIIRYANPPGFIGSVPRATYRRISHDAADNSAVVTFHIASPSKELIAHLEIPFHSIDACVISCRKVRR